MTLDYYNPEDDDNFLSRFRESLRASGVGHAESLDALLDALVDATLDGFGFEKDLSHVPWGDDPEDFDVIDAILFGSATGLDDIMGPDDWRELDEHIG